MKKLKVLLEELSYSAIKEALATHYPIMQAVDRESPPGGDAPNAEQLDAPVFKTVCVGILPETSNMEASEIHHCALVAFWAAFLQAFPVLPGGVNDKGQKVKLLMLTGPTATQNEEGLVIRARAALSPIKAAV